MKTKVIFLDHSVQFANLDSWHWPKNTIHFKKPCPMPITITWQISIKILAWKLPLEILDLCPIFLGQTVVWYVFVCWYQSWIAQRSNKANYYKSFFYISGELYWSAMWSSVGQDRRRVAACWGSGGFLSLASLLPPPSFLLTLCQNSEECLVTTHGGSLFRPLASKHVTYYGGLPIADTEMEAILITLWRYLCGVGAATNFL